jgi:hypothetical protein
MSVGETLLKSSPLSLDAGAAPTGPADAAVLQPQQLTATQQLLCTGEVEDVRGASGTFPPSVAALGAAGQSVYHPPGFVCRWELFPEQPDVLLSIDYRTLLPDEAIMLVLGPNNIIRLGPTPEGGGAMYQASLWVERSILVAFQTTASNTSRVGAFSVSWTSVSGGAKGGLDGKTMVVVLACVSAAGAVLAGCCFYFVCCGRRRRRAAVSRGRRRGAVHVHVHVHVLCALGPAMHACARQRAAAPIAAISAASQHRLCRHRACAGHGGGRRRRRRRCCRDAPAARAVVCAGAAAQQAVPGA